MLWRTSILALALAAMAAAQVAHQEHPPRSAGEYARVLEDPGRDAWQKPHDVVMALKLRADEVIADIGAGTGYFSRRFAHHAGKVLAVDIDAKLLEIATKGAPPNLTTILAAPDDPKLGTKSVDTVFFCDVLHHIANRPAYYVKLKAALKPGGRVVIVDFYKRELPVGPPPAMKLSPEEVQAELKAAGFHQAGSFDILAHQYFLVFQAN
ncbi:MAG TPA: class I SAM-dependent methyltransferase [Paludibaculum sp.]